MKMPAAIALAITNQATIIQPIPYLPRSICNCPREPYEEHLAGLAS